MSRIKETIVMLFLLVVLVNCVAWLLSSMLGGIKLSQENILGMSSHYASIWKVLNDHSPGHLNYI